nr:unnamed protein product [Callosobruchus analis]
MESFIGSFYCGRCRPKGIPNRPFEEAAAKVLFPCRYNCGAHFTGNHTLQHETSCINRTIVCPSVNCMNTSTLQDLCGHIKASHQACYQETRIKYMVNIDRLTNVIYWHCIRFDKLFFLFFVQFRSQADIINCKYKVCSLWPRSYVSTEFYNMQLRLEIEIPESDLKVIKLIQSKSIHNYYDRMHCVNCVCNCCDKSLHENKSDWLKRKLSLNVKNNFEGNLYYTITVCKKETVSETEPNNLLECPICMDYMTGQIHFCTHGHSLCGVCREKLTNRTCPVCRGNLLNSRNFAMENLVKVMEIPCRKKITGCTFIGRVAAVQKHEKTCKYV